MCSNTTSRCVAALKRLVRRLLVASDPEPEDSVLDVLYADTRRVSALLSQFGTDGVLTEFTRLTEAGSEADRALDLKVVKLGTKENDRSATTRRFDPQWLIPFLLLDKASDQIHRDVTSAPIGSLAMVKGRLVVTDPMLLKELWKSPVMRKNLLAESSKTATLPPHATSAEKAAARAAAAESKAQAESLFEILPMLPHSPQLSVLTEDEVVWSTIDQSYLVGTVSDLILKHGDRVAGEWSMVGVLDARPVSEDDNWGVLSAYDKMRLGYMQDSIWKAALDIGPAVKMALGRPLTSYGMTPLIVFREVASTASR
jgi:hypothetical protein